MMDTLETAYYAGLVVKTNKSDLNNLELKENPIGARILTYYCNTG